MDAIWNEIKTTNEEKVLEICEKTIDDVFVKYLKENIDHREYEKAGGHRRYKRDVERTKDEYVSVLRDFEQNEILSTWYGFVESMTTTEAKIVEADDTLSQKEKEAEQKKNQEQLDELMKNYQKAQEDALEKQKQNLHEHYEKLDKDRLEQQQINNKMYKDLVTERLEKEAAQREIERCKSSEEAAQRESERYRREKEAADEAIRRADIELKEAKCKAERYRKEKRKALKEKEKAREKAIRHEIEIEYYNKEKEERRNENMLMRIGRAISNK